MVENGGSLRNGSENINDVPTDGSWFRWGLQEIWTHTLQLSVFLVFLFVYWYPLITSRELTLTYLMLSYLQLIAPYLYFSVCFFACISPRLLYNECIGPLYSWTRKLASVAK